MNKKILSSLIIAVALITSGCQTTDVIQGSDGGQVVSNSETVFSLIDLSDRVKFIGKSEGSDILTKADDIFFRLDEFESKKVFGDVEYTDNEKKMKFLFNRLLEWDKGYVDLTVDSVKVGTENNSEESESSSDEISDETTDEKVSQEEQDNYDKTEEQKLFSLIGGEISDRDKVTTIMLELEKTMASLNLKFPKEVNLCKFDDLFIDEDAFTTNNTIFLSESLIKGHKQVLKEELIRQLTYVYLDNNEDKAERLYGAFGFEKCLELFESGELGHVHVNPSNPVVNHVFNGVYKGRSYKFMPIETLNESTYTNSDGKEIKELVKETKYYAVEINEESTKLLKFDSSLTINEKGMPLGVKIDDMDNFYNYFTHSHDVNYNPKRIVADYLVDMLTGRGINDTKIHSMLTNIILN